MERVSDTCDHAPRVQAAVCVCVYVRVNERVGAHWFGIGGMGGAGLDQGVLLWIERAPK